jgi:hypothetical protein
LLTTSPNVSFAAISPGERIQEQKVTAGAQRQPWFCARSLLILERRHLIAILPRRGAHVTELTAHSVRSLCTLMSELYILLGNAVAQGWQVQADLARFCRSSSAWSPVMNARTSAPSSKTASMVMRAAYPFANNPYCRRPSKTCSRP